MLGFTCDVCGREVQGTTFVNGMKFCAKCYQETFGNDNNLQNNAQYTEHLLRENAQLKDELKARKKLCDFRYEQLKKQDEEIKVLNLALELACKDISLYEDITTPKYKTKCYIQQAKEKLNENSYEQNGKK